MFYHKHNYIDRVSFGTITPAHLTGRSKICGMSFTQPILFKKARLCPTFMCFLWQKEYADKYSIYMRLHKLINDNRIYFEALTSQLSKGGSESEQDALFKRLETDWEVTGTLSLRWSHARLTLHEELRSCRERLEEFLATYEG